VIVATYKPLLIIKSKKKIDGTSILRKAKDVKTLLTKFISFLNDQASKESRRDLEKEYMALHVDRSGMTDNIRLYVEVLKKAPDDPEVLAFVETLKTINQKMQKLKDDIENYDSKCQESLDGYMKPKNIRITVGSSNTSIASASTSST
jgi:hypothetical protein